MPAYDDALELISMVGPLATTSANISGEPTPSSVESIASALGDAVAIYLDGSLSAADMPSSIVDVTGFRPKIVREGVIGRREIDKVLG